MAYPDETNPGQFIGTTQIYDLGKANVNAEDFTVRLRQNFNNLVMALNIKDSGYYSQEEFVNGQLFYPDYTRVDSASSAPATFRQVFRKVIDLGGMPGIGATTYPLNISGYPAAGATTFIFTRIYGCATDQTNRLAIPLPYSDPIALVNNIGLSISGTNLVVTTGFNWAAYTRAHVVVEFLKF